MKSTSLLALPASLASLALAVASRAAFASATSTTGELSSLQGLRGRSSFSSYSSVAMPNMNARTDSRALGLGPLPGQYTVVVDIDTLQATGFNCSVLGYNSSSNQGLQGVTCEVGCKGNCGIITFDYHETCEGMASKAVADYYMSGGMNADTTVQYASEMYEDIGTPDALCFAASFDMSIQRSNGEVVVLHDLRLGYEPNYSNDWWIGGPTCENVETYMVCGNTIGLEFHCNELFDDSDGLTDACIRVGVVP